MKANNDEPTKKTASEDVPLKTPPKQNRRKDDHPNSQGSIEQNEEKERVAHLEEVIERLKSDIEESYYRVPKQEFENITVKKISSDVSHELNQKLQSLRNWVAVIILILSFMGITQFTNVTQNIHDQTTRTIDEKFIKLNETMDSNFEKELAKFEANFNRIAQEAAQQETKKQIQTIRDDIRLAQLTAFQTKLDDIKKELRQDRNYKSALIKLNLILPKALALGDKSLSQAYLDELFGLNFDLFKYEELDKLRVQYEHDYELSYLTWTHVAIADMFLYEEFYSTAYKHRAIEAIDRALDLFPSYGVPSIVHVMLLMIDLEREGGELAPNLTSQINRILKRLSSGSRTDSAYEAYNYLQKLKNDKTMSIFYMALYKKFPNDMSILKERYQAHVDARAAASLPN
ncbi:hypothetical protein [Flocculibacter collagenilyticus]|uniref:hypothetical protein n=1 Tax=Flocculibacter collagenilyticus TaxID=2744479 RepID=UPI0018F7B005|nr:hypothetical protein [Flocculibacter collagenilyticus]